MNLNATLVAQMVVFLILWWTVAKFIWPKLTATLDARALKISEGLAAAERGHADFEALSQRIKQEEDKARTENAQRIADAQKRAQLAGEEIKQQAKAEAERIVTQAKADVEQQIAQARDALRLEVAALAVKGAEQILRREVNPQAHADLLDQLKGQLKAQHG